MDTFSASSALSEGKLSITSGFFSGRARNADHLGCFDHYDDVIMTMLASQITSLTVVYSIVYSGVNQRKHQSSASLAFVWEIHRGPVNFPHKWPVTRKIFPFDDVIMVTPNTLLTKQWKGREFVICFDSVMVSCRIGHLFSIEPGWTKCIEILT